ncbi:patatin-like phospholipase family protein [Gilvimarinus agarilyticus]|uniref:patatin-like phospholipase family protein n=1 Tax=Gilvimarinus agarilyticus TaxID=679259 RepID=UPI00059F4E70|nr:patatin-like phospholipase family protein [Gilvimarinus agarilyticus]
MTRIATTVLALLCLCSAKAFANPPPCPAELERPCVALVLGGGGARGGAHIGVIRALEERGIAVDMVVGTSIGAFVGALYASGKTDDEILHLFEQADWDAGYHDDLPRGQIPNRRKRQMDEFPIQLNLGFDGTSLKLPQGFLQGQGMKSLLDELMGTHVIFNSFDDLPIAFRAVAANIETGEQVILDRGDLTTALQTSMSLPGVVRPIERDGRLLVDGGIANNLPISVAKDMGADVVIAVDIGSPAMTRDELQSGLSILRQLTSFLTVNNVHQQTQLLGEQDVLIRPQLTDVTLLSFDKAADAADQGYLASAAAFESSPSIAQLNATARPKTPADFLLSDKKILIDDIALTNHTRLSDNYILHRMGISSGEAYSPQEIRQGIERLYGQGTIARARSSIDKQAGKTRLNSVIDEKEWGPGYLDFKLLFEDNLKSFSRYQVGASYRRTNLSSYGAEWYTTAAFGTEKNFATELYWPLKTSGFYASGEVFAELDVFSYTIDSASLGEVIGNEYGAVSGIGWDAFDRLDLFAGFTYSDGNLTLPAIIAAELEQSEVDYSEAGGIFSLDFDSLDNANFPRQGWKFNTSVKRTNISVLSEKGQATQAELDLNGAFSLGRHSVRSRIIMHSTFNDDPLSLIGSASLGGFLNLSGNDADSISGQHTRFASVIYTYRIADNDYRILDLPLYFGLSYEMGNAWLEQDAIDYSDLIISGSAFLGWDSPLGPTYLAYGESDTGKKSAYVYLGVTF